MSKQLSHGEFSIALRKGHGRALRYVLEYDLDEVSDLVLAACLKLQAFDPQCEGTREQWLLQMIERSPQYSYFVERILTALAVEAIPSHREQLCRFAREFALRGDSRAYIALRDMVLQRINEADDYDWVGTRELVESNGSEAALALARAFGKRLMADPDLYPHNILEDIDEPAIRSSIVQVLSDAARHEVAVAHYLSFVKSCAEHSANLEPVEERRARWVEEFRRKVTVEVILTDCEISWFTYNQFGRHATLDELQLVYQRLITATDEDECTRLLKVFRRARMPELNGRLFGWALSKDADLRSAALSALANIKDERVGDFARGLLASDNPLVIDSDLLRLLQLNYRNSDVDLIMAAIVSRCFDTDNAHSIGLSILDIADISKSDELTPALLWVYENTPCACCRHSSVLRMHNCGQLPARIVDECRFDSYPDLREFAATII